MNPSSTTTFAAAAAAAMLAGVRRSAGQIAAGDGLEMAAPRCLEGRNKSAVDARGAKDAPAEH
jgi:membrane-associated phospholipid phosphatase